MFSQQYILFLYSMNRQRLDRPKIHAVTLRTDTISI